MCWADGLLVEGRGIAAACHQDYFWTRGGLVNAGGPNAAGPRSWDAVAAIPRGCTAERGPLGYYFLKGQTLAFKKLKRPHAGFWFQPWSYLLNKVAYFKGLFFLQAHRALV